jgi:glutathione S-transferase
VDGGHGGGKDSKEELSMIELLQFKPALGMMNLSPFCMKVEVFLRLAGLPYRCVEAMPLRSPKGKLPVLRDGGSVVCDSSAIVAHLQQRHGAAMPASLREPDAGERLALRRLVEEHLYFVLLWTRWLTDEGWAIMRPAFFGNLPVLPALVRRKIRRDLLGQGVGRHQADEIVARGREDLDALAQSLGTQRFFGGDEPGAIDATVYAFLANLLWVPLDLPLRRHLAAQPALVAYCERLRARIGQ